VRRAPSLRRSRVTARALSLALAALALSLALAACGNPSRRNMPQLADQVSNGDKDPRLTLLSELKAEILDGYQRDDLPELEAAVLPQLGPTRIGVGPGDFLFDQELLNASSRWPLTTANIATTVRSKHLDVYLASDLSAGWFSDEVSWRLQICDRTLIIPLRITALYARDGDRWVLAVEHVSSGAQLAAEESMVGSAVGNVAVSSALASAVSTSVATTLGAPIASSPLLSAGPESILIGPGWSQEWRGPDLVGKQLVPGTLTVEQARIGTVGQSIAEATVAFWVGNLLATSAAGARTRLRGSYVLERREDKWVVVQGHVSLPVDDSALASNAIGSALVSLNPLAAKCDDVPGGTEKNPMPVPNAAAGSAAPSTSGSAPRR
jgi:SnoaL-like domain